MKRNIAMRWIRALEAGRYKQARNSLCRYDADGNKIGHCCLGVLTEIAAKEGVRGAKSALSRLAKYEESSRSSYLPTYVMKWAGMSSNCGFISGLDNLASRNDLGFSFKELAMRIRKHWKEL